METWIINHWEKIAIIWLITIKVLTAVQDAIDAEPKDTPILRKIVNIMNAAGQYIFFGNRPTIGGQK